MTKPIDALKQAIEDSIKRMRNQQYTAGLQDALEIVKAPPVPAAHEGLGEVMGALKAAKEMSDWFMQHSRQADHAHEELGQPLHETAGWKEMVDSGYNGLMASYEQQFDEAIATLDAIIVGETEPVKDTWTCPDCCVNPCGCKIMGEYGHRPEDCATHPAGNSAPATQAYQQVREALEALYRHSHGIWKRRGGEDKYEPDIYEKCRKALAAMLALRPVERGEVSVVAKIKRASFLPEQRDIEAKELVIYSSQAIGFVEDAARTTEPVSSPVSLEKCARAAAMAHGIVPNKGNMEYWKPQAKAVLDSAKQQGAQIIYAD